MVRAVMADSTAVGLISKCDRAPKASRDEFIAGHVIPFCKFIELLVQRSSFSSMAFSSALLIAS
jgi:hypothetical protein